MSVLWSLALLRGCGAATWAVLLPRLSDVDVDDLDEADALRLHDVHVLLGGVSGEDRGPVAPADAFPSSLAAHCASVAAAAAAELATADATRSTDLRI